MIRTSTNRVDQEISRLKLDGTDGMLKRLSRYANTASLVVGGLTDGEMSAVATIHAAAPSGKAGDEVRKAAEALGMTNGAYVVAQSKRASRATGEQAKRLGYGAYAPRTDDAS